jgi:hypothetical protein
LLVEVEINADRFEMLDRTEQVSVMVCTRPAEGLSRWPNSPKS